MLEAILIIVVLFMILTFFYKQAVCEFRINQIEWSQKDAIGPLLSEKVPLVVRSIPSATFWTHEDVNVRNCYKDIPIFQKTSLADWISTSTPESICPWKYSQGEIIAGVSGIQTWVKKWLNDIIINPLLKFWIFPKYHCWAGKVGLRKLFPTWTCLFPVDGEIIVTIMPESVEQFLPAKWVGCFPSTLTNKDTPFVGDLKFIDIILRPGNCLFMPAHWFVSWVSSDKCDKAPMTCTISYHSPVSLMAFNMSPFTR